jgi:acylphosphatase
VPQTEPQPPRFSAKIVLIGHFDIVDFLDFVSDRAARLDLEMVVEGFSTERFEVDVAGQPGLVDAFEMACSLGPNTCLVLEVLR